MTPKIENKGVMCVMAGYTMDYAGDCYRMWDPNTNWVHENHDVTWLHRMYFDKLVKHKDISTKTKAGEEQMDDLDTAGIQVEEGEELINLEAA
jgi:hypothetical protein